MNKVLLSCFAFFLIASTAAHGAEAFSVDFMATGKYSMFDSVRIRNLSQGTSLTILGDDWIRLKEIEQPTAISHFQTGSNVRLSAYPNPANGEATLTFFAPEEGSVQIIVRRSDGVTMTQTQQYVSRGTQQFHLSELGQGSFLITAQGATYRYTKMLMSYGSSSQTPSIQYNGGSAQDKHNTFEALGTALKSDHAGTEHEVQFAMGDTLEYKGYRSGVTTDIVMDIIPSTKPPTIELNFPTLLVPIQYNGALYVAPEDSYNGIMQWNNYPQWVETFASSATNGHANTDSILKYQGIAVYAAYVCESLNVHGCSDWYLPAKDELNFLYENRHAIGGFCTSGEGACRTAFYWSSTETGMVNAWGQFFDTGSQSTTNKCGAYRVRCVRRP